MHTPLDDDAAHINYGYFVRGVLFLKSFPLTATVGVETGLRGSFPDVLFMRSDLKLAWHTWLCLFLASSRGQAHSPLLPFEERLTFAVRQACSKSHGAWTITIEILQRSEADMQTLYACLYKTSG